MPRNTQDGKILRLFAIDLLNRGTRVEKAEPQMRLTTLLIEHLEHRRVAASTELGPDR